MSTKRRQYDEWGLPYLPYFTHEILAHDWPPGWLPSEWSGNEVLLSQLATQNREGQIALGRTGTMVGISDKADARAKSVTMPGWMGEKP